MASSIPHQTRTEDPANAHWEITARAVKDLQRRGEDFLLLDCRSSEEWEAGGIEGAVSVPLQQMSTRSPELEPHRDRPIVTYCRTGRRSIIVAKYLRLAGFVHVRSMAGGLEAWSSLLTTTRDDS